MKNFIYLLLFICCCLNSKAQETKKEGCISGDCQNGEGIYLDAHGMTYEGYFKDGKRSGFGVYKTSTGRIIKSGEWLNNAFLVNPKKSNLVNSNQQNEVKNGCISGDCQNGNGTFIAQNGEKFIGPFKDGVPNGKGTWYLSDGSIMTGNFINYDIDGKYDIHSLMNEKVFEVKNSNKYDIKINDDNYPYNFKLFKNIVATNNSFYSLVYSPPSGEISNQQASRIGKFNIKTSKETLLTKEMNSNSNEHNRENINAYNLNNDLDKLNKIFKTSRDRNKTTFDEVTIDDNTGDISTKSFSVPNEFELKDNGSIETFNVINSVIGNGIIAFYAYSTFNSKVYLFIYDYNISSVYKKIDLSKYISSLTSVNQYLYYRGLLNGKNYSAQCFINSVIRNDKYTYVFFRIGQDELIPIRIDANNNVNLINQSIFIYGKDCRNQEFTGDYVCNDGLFYLPVSQGIVNYFNNSSYLDNKNNSSTLKVYDDNLKFNWQKSINDIVINHVYESGNYIIVGGYTKVKGYVGYPNPRIIVINKMTKSITYDKVLPKKNSEVDFISLDVNGSILFGIGSICCQTMDTDAAFKPLIITDKLNDEGIFENDMFDK